MYEFLEEQLETQFSIVSVFHQSPEKTILRLRHKVTRADFVMHRFRGETVCYEKLLNIKSPYLPEILEVAAHHEASGQVLVLEEYIEGDVLSSMLEKARFTEKETRAIALDVCRALYILHSLDIIHRDVKPENIILRNSHAVLLDFDAARIRKEAQFSDTRALGTTGFAAPEQYGISQTDGRADIYALGVTMNLLLTGTHPSTELAKGRLGKIITKCTMVHPDQRYQSIEKLMEVLA